MENLSNIKKYLLTIEVQEEQIKAVNLKYKILHQREVQKTININYGNEQLKDIIEYTSLYHNVCLEDILSRSRKRYIIDIVKLIIFYLREHEGLTLQRMGYLLNRNHATILHLYKKFVDEYEVYKDFRDNYENLKTFMNSKKECKEIN